MRVSGHRFFSASIAGTTISKQRFWQIAILTAAGSVVADNRSIAPSAWPELKPGAGAANAADGSCMIVVATDAPLDSRDLKRLAARAIYAQLHKAGPS